MSEYSQWLYAAQEQEALRVQEERNYTRALNTLLKYYEQFKPVLRALEREGYLVRNHVKDMVMRVRADSTQGAYEHISKQNRQVVQEPHRKDETYTTPQLSLVIEHPQTEAAVLLALTAVKTTPAAANGKQYTPEDSLHILWKYDTDNVAAARQEIESEPDSVQELIGVILDGLHQEVARRR